MGRQASANVRHELLCVQVQFKARAVTERPAAASHPPNTTARQSLDARHGERERRQAREDAEDAIWGRRGRHGEQGEADRQLDPEQS
eukprot:13384049-Alexandrium_andersonii.AAC.1